MMEWLPKIRSAVQEPAEVFWWTLKKGTKPLTIDVPSEDWDNLILLDGCRADLFASVNTIAGTFRTVRSKGTHTGEFLRENFADDAFPDTVYVSANPQLVNHGVQSNFHECFHLWESMWDEELRTVPPEAVVERTEAVFDRFPNKRLIVHFVQPHYPFIGEVGRSIHHGTITGDGVIADSRTHPNIWTQLENGEVGEEFVWEAYRENLELTLPHVADLCDLLDGKTVITSDHGNAFGEWGVYGHPGGRHIRPLNQVPWLEIAGDRRRRIESEDTTESAESDEKIVGDRLKHLGYVDE